MIKLTEAEVKFILACKGHFRNELPHKSNWTLTLKPIFKEFYGWYEGYSGNEYRNVLFQKLLDIYLKIQQDNSGFNYQLKSVFSAAFNRGIVRDQRQSIDRAINELCGLIQCNTVIEDGVKRYNLD